MSSGISSYPDEFTNYKPAGDRINYFFLITVHDVPLDAERITVHNVKVV